jgi:hypothetical protein
MWETSDPQKPIKKAEKQRIFGDIAGERSTELSRLNQSKDAKYA